MRAGAAAALEPAKWSVTAFIQAQKEYLKGQAENSDSEENLTDDESS